MKIQPINQSQQNNPSFGYHTHIKDCWMAGKLPSVKLDCYGFKLTKKNCSNEHIICASKGGKLNQGNILLANKWLNNLRGDEPIENYLTKRTLIDYLAQFIGIRVKHHGRVFDGDSYIEDVNETMKHIDLKA